MVGQLSIWKDNSSGLANQSQLMNTSSSMTPAVLDVTPVHRAPAVLHPQVPLVFRSRKEIFEEALHVTISRNRETLEELGKL